MDTTSPPMHVGSGVPKRGKRTLAALGLSFFILVSYWFFPHTFHSLFHKSKGVPTYRDSSWSRLDEIRSLIYFTTLPPTAANRDSLLIQRDEPEMLSKALTPYTFGALSNSASKDWVAQAKQLDKTTPVVIFSKTYCRFSKKAKALIESMNIEPKPLIIEVDLREDADIIKAHLQRLTGRGTFPNVMIQTRSIGGADDIEELHRQGMLEVLLRSGGVNVRGN